ncbi:MAG: tripartite tricarboxylate transporter substrate binding protein, partial [Roseomonas sp.]|nr:tripartite tricarboxylate transporter substrate binding protein [Roseomonas sp.]
MTTRRAVIAAGLALPAIARAQDRAMQLMVGAPPGGPFDLAARPAAPFCERYRRAPRGGVPRAGA